MDTAMDIRSIPQSGFPPLLREITDPPKRLFIQGALPPPETKYLCVVGSRRYSPYGKNVCERLIRGLSGYPVAIVSGLALGIDGIAHEAAISAGLPTIAVPGSGLSENILYPRAHVGLARRIVREGGTLLSEYDSEQKAGVWSFPERNRLMAGMSHAILIIEASEKSGTLITARLGMEYNRDVLVVPGSVLSDSANGSNALLREGAQAVCESKHILEVLKIKIDEQETMNDVQRKDITDEEQKIFKLLTEPMTRDEVVRVSGMPLSQAQIVISTMEIKGILTERLGKMERA
ncbi:MAG: DNA-processing protein DprA [Patescibacteria group bacterium]